MEQIYWVKNGELYEVNKWLQRGGRVKSINVVQENISSYGYGAGGYVNEHGNYVGNVYAYIVVEFD